MNYYKILPFLLLIGFNLYSQEDSLVYKVYLIGDAGKDDSLSNINLTNFKNSLKQDDPKRTSIIFLGDNLYPRGLSDKKSENYSEEKKHLDFQLNIIKEFNGDITFIPGNHDWDKSGEIGYQKIKNQQKYIEKALDRKNVFLPKNGCADPEIKIVSDDLVIIFIDTQWWIHSYKKGVGIENNCEISTKEDYSRAIAELLKKNRRKNIIVAAHHPMFSYGKHGGNFPLKDHLFPLKEKNEKLNIPLPIIGSIYPLYRKYIGDPQDIAHPDYRKLIKEIVSEISRYGNVIYACGHEHNLQYHLRENTHYIVSGSGSKSTHVKKNIRKSDFVSPSRGYASVSYYHSGQVFLDLISKANDTLFHQNIYTKHKIKIPETVFKTNYPDSVTVVSDSLLTASRLKKVFFGANNRKHWVQPIKVPVFNFETSMGKKLSPVQLGGGMSTSSLRLKDLEGNEYTMRSVSKSSEYLVNYKLVGTPVEKVIKDGISSSHPIAALVVPKLTEATDIHHAKTKLFFVPKVKELGEFANTMGDRLCLIEMRPDDDMSNFSNFGSSKKVVNTSKVVEKTLESSKHKIDPHYFARARLLDLFLGDWDRHDDQWRWASFKENDTTYYQPIPRDRDQVFYKNNGVFPWITSRKWAVRKLQKFDNKVRDLPGLAFNARYFDRDFASHIPSRIWLEEAKKLQKQLTDSIIRLAIQEFPPETFAIDGEEIIEKLIHRRKQLTKWAIKHHNFIAKEVNIKGTDGKDFFKINTEKNGDLTVSAFSKKEDITPFYSRKFNRKITKEVRVYTIDGSDEISISGKSKRKTPKLRIIASENNVKLNDESQIKGIGKRNNLYILKGEGEVIKNEETKVHEQEIGTLYYYDRRSYQYDNLSPVPSLGFNQNDGLLLGAGFKFTKHGFEKNPYKYYHKVLANKSIGTDLMNIYYETDYANIFKNAHFQVEGILNRPLVYTFEGLGNEPVQSGPLSTNIRMRRAIIFPKLVYYNRLKNLNLTLGAGLEDVSFDNSFTGFEAREFEDDSFLKTHLSFNYSNADRKLHPSSGIGLHTGVNYINSLRNGFVNYMNIDVNVNIYIPSQLFGLKTRYAFRSGLAHNDGITKFFQYNFLDGLKNFRGISRNRFSGETMFFNNFDYRLDFFNGDESSSIFYLGMLLHADIARVWLSGEDSKRFNTSAGTGVYTFFSEAFGIVATYSVSNVSNAFIIQGNFLF